MKSTCGWRARSADARPLVRRRVERALAAEREELTLGLEERRVRRRVRLGHDDDLGVVAPAAREHARGRAVMTSAWRWVCARATGARPLASSWRAACRRAAESSKPRAAHATAAASSSTLSSAAATGAWFRCRSSSSAGEAAVRRDGAVGRPARGRLRTRVGRGALVLREAQRRVGRDALPSAGTLVLEHVEALHALARLLDLVRAARRARRGRHEARGARRARPPAGATGRARASARPRPRAPRGARRGDGDGGAPARRGRAPRARAAWSARPCRRRAGRAP